MAEKYLLPATTRVLLGAMAALQKGWTRKRYAVDANGGDVNPTSADACAFCAEGALMVGRDLLAEGFDSPKARLSIRAAREMLVAQIGGLGVAHWNDSTPGLTQADVIAAFKAAALASV